MAKGKTSKKKKEQVSKKVGLTVQRAVALLLVLIILSSLVVMGVSMSSLENDSSSSGSSSETFADEFDEDSAEEIVQSNSLANAATTYTNYESFTVNEQQPVYSSVDLMYDATFTQEEGSVYERCESLGQFESDEELGTAFEEYRDVIAGYVQESEYYTKILQEHTVENQYTLIAYSDEEEENSVVVRLGTETSGKQQLETMVSVVDYDEECVMKLFDAVKHVTGVVYTINDYNAMCVVLNEQIPQGGSGTVTYQDLVMNTSVAVSITERGTENEAWSLVFIQVVDDGV